MGTRRCASLTEECFKLLFHIMSVLEARSCQEVQYCMDNQSCLHYSVVESHPHHSRELW